MLDLQLTPSQRELLASIPHRFPIERIDRIWLFSAHLGKVRETGLFVVSLLPAQERETAQRTLFTLRYHAEAGKGGVQRTETLSEEGAAPPERIDRVIAGVLARSGEEAGDPLVAAIEGDEAQWLELLARLGLTA